MFLTISSPQELGYPPAELGELPRGARDKTQQQKRISSWVVLGEGGGGEL